MNKSSVVLKITDPTSKKLQAIAKWYAEQPGLNFVEDDKTGLLPVLQIAHHGTFLEIDQMRLNFHPSMSLLRVIQLQRGESDRFLKATGLKEGDIFLDATLGIGSDALIAATKVGDAGKVIGIEASPLLAALVEEGLQKLYQNPLPKVKNENKLAAWMTLSQAANRIEVVWGEHLHILSQYPSKSVDVIYFDPMFRHTREESASIRPLHSFSNTDSLNERAIREACRVAKRRVVLKERKASSEFLRLGFRIYEGGKYSRVDYGVIDV